MLLFIDNDVSHACELIELLQKDKNNKYKNLSILDNMSTLLHLYKKEEAKRLWEKYNQYMNI